MNLSLGHVDDRIVGGEECGIESVPFLASICSSIRLKHYCGGSLLSPQWVLSAAHCFKNPENPKEVKVVVGRSETQRGKIQVIRAKKIFNHENWNNKTFANDISLILLERKLIMFLGVVALVKLPTRVLDNDLSEYCNSSFAVAGWGSTKAWLFQAPPYKPSAHLKCVDLPYIPNDDCLRYSARAYNPNIMCTLVPEGGKDACQGDSGGPLYCGDVQYGIVSFGSGCASPNRPGYSTRVDKYLDFIGTTMKSIDDRSRASKLCSTLKVFAIVFFPLIMDQLFCNKH